MSVVDPALSKESEEGVEASTSGMMETTMMEGEEYYNPDETGTWTQKATTDQLCRICAKPNQYLIPIFEGEGIEHQLEPKIQKHLPIEVSETDDLPLQVCYQCASTLIAWNDLVIACVEADKKLRQMHEQEEEDEDDKGAEFFDEPTMDSDEGEEPVQPSTSTATVTSEVQGDTPSPPKKAAGKAKKPKLKMTLVKSPTAGPSSQKSPPKKTLAKSKEAASQDATERLPQAPQKTSLVIFLRSHNETRVEQFIKRPKSVLENNLRIKITNVRSVSRRTSRLPQDSNKFCGGRVGKVKQIKHINSKKLGRTGNKNEIDLPNTDAMCSDGDNDVKLDSSQDKVCETINEGVCRHDDDNLGNAIKVESRQHSENETIEEGVRTIFECDYCSKIIVRKDNLIAHMRIHTGECPYTCHICGKSFRQSKGIRRHIKEFHERVRNFPCIVCGTSFLNKRTLGDHMTIHSSKREFICDVCGKTYKTKSGVNHHKIYHTDNFPFPCSYCDKKFRTRSALSLHLPRHTKEKPHECCVCGKCFGVKNDLTRHSLVHSSKDTFTCSVCGHTFKQKRYLQMHEKSHHK